MVFRWNEWNLEHATCHGVSVEECEAVISNALEPFPYRIELDKLIVVGRGRKGRWLQVIFVFSPEDTIFVIHARPCTRAEVRAMKGT